MYQYIPVAANKEIIESKGTLDLLGNIFREIEYVKSNNKKKTLTGKILINGLSDSP